jgi:hypothetical protein
MGVAEKKNKSEGGNEMEILGFSCGGGPRLIDLGGRRR